MTESESYRCRRELLDQVDAELLQICERVFALTRKGLPEDRFDVRMQVSMRLEQLTEAVDTALGYFELHPADLAESADLVVLVDRSGPEPLESTYLLDDWRTHGPQILTAALRLWGTAGGQVRLSGSWLAGRGTITTESGTYTAAAWYAADAKGAIWPEREA